MVTGCWVQSQGCQRPRRGLRFPLMGPQGLVWGVLSLGLVTPYTLAQSSPVPPAVPAQPLPSFPILQSARLLATSFLLSAPLWAREDLPNA